MNSLILRKIAPILIILILLFSFIVLFRGHNEPGGGFIGGLIAASAMSLFSTVFGVQKVRNIIYFDTMTLAGFGMLIAIINGVTPYIKQMSFLSGVSWKILLYNENYIYLSTSMIFDISVWLIVVSTVTTIIFTLEEIN